MHRLRSKEEIADIKKRVETEQQSLYPDHDITVSVNRFSPPRNGDPDWIVTCWRKLWLACDF